MGTVVIEDLSLRVHVGVTDRERSRKQRILVSVEIDREVRPGEIGDRIEGAIDYSEVRSGIAGLVESASFNLIETIAERIALSLKGRYAERGVGVLRVTVKKFPYRDARYVAYRMSL